MSWYVIRIVASVLVFLAERDEGVMSAHQVKIWFYFYMSNRILNYSAYV